LLSDIHTNILGDQNIVISNTAAKSKAQKNL
jgi:hypothetical protein